MDVEEDDPDVREMENGADFEDVEDGPPRDQVRLSRPLSACRWTITEGSRSH